MTDDLGPERQPIRPRRHWLRYALLGMVIVMVIGAWTYAWARGREIMLTSFDLFLAREYAAGRAHDCPGKSVGGYPFHLTLSCDSVVLRLPGPAGEVAVSAQGLKAVAMVYAARHVIAELTAPVVVRQGDATVLQANFTEAWFSFRHDFKGLERFSFEARDMAVAADPASPAFSSKNLELHLRPSPRASSAALQDFDFAVNIEQALLPGAAPDQIGDLMIAGKLEAWPKSAASAQGALEQWRTGEGKLSLSDMRLKRNGGLLHVSGEARLNETHRLDGRFDAVFINSAALLRGLIMNGSSDAGALFGPLLPILGKPVTFEGQKASRLQMTMTNGVLSLGSLVLADVPPLY